MPRCGFSMRVVGILDQLGVDYGAVDVLPALQPLREVTAELADWQTFPQLYVDGELAGGADIVEELLESGELPSCSESSSRPATAPEPRIPPGARRACRCSSASAGPARLVPLGGALPALQGLIATAFSLGVAARGCAERSGFDHREASPSSSSSPRSSASAASTSCSSRSSSARRFLLGPAGLEARAAGEPASSPARGADPASLVLDPASGVASAELGRRSRASASRPPSSRARSWETRRCRQSL